MVGLPVPEAFALDFALAIAPVTALIRAMASGIGSLAALARIAAVGAFAARFRPANISSSSGNSVIAAPPDGSATAAAAPRPVRNGVGEKAVRSVFSSIGIGVGSKARATFNFLKGVNLGGTPSISRI